MPDRLDITARLHDQLLEIVRSALPLITRSLADADLAGLAHLRGEMVEAIERYYSHVGALREAAILGHDADALAGADLLEAGCADLRCAYHRFRARWVDRTPAENWPEYRLSVMVMVRHIRTAVMRAQQIHALRPRLAA